MLRTFFTIDFRFLGNFGPDLEKSLFLGTFGGPSPADPQISQMTEMMEP